MQLLEPMKLAMNIIGRSRYEKDLLATIKRKLILFGQGKDLGKALGNGSQRACS